MRGEWDAVFGRLTSGAQPSGGHQLALASWLLRFFAGAADDERMRKLCRTLKGGLEQDQAALSFGGDSGAYYHGDAAAPDGLPYTGPDFEAYTPPVEIMHAWDQADRSVDWTRAAVEERGSCEIQGDKPAPRHIPKNDDEDEDIDGMLAAPLKRHGA